jgi:predicted N-acetyltransferase YhbS
LSLAPVSVHPEHQRQGVGRAMIAEALEKAKKLNHSSVLVVGSPEYYRKFGFESADKYGIMSPIMGFNSYLMAKELQPKALENISGVVIYPKEFFTKYNF